MSCWAQRSWARDAKARHGRFSHCCAISSILPSYSSFMNPMPSNAPEIAPAMLRSFREATSASMLTRASVSRPGFRRYARRRPALRRFCDAPGARDTVRNRRPRNLPWTSWCLVEHAGTRRDATLVVTDCEAQTFQEPSKHVHKNPCGSTTLLGNVTTFALGLQTNSNRFESVQFDSSQTELI
jgi:hypothetical protein